MMHDGEEKSVAPRVQAAVLGHANVVSVLIERGSTSTSIGHRALNYGHQEAAIYLLDPGADVNAKNNRGFTPLSSAAQEGHLPLVDLLVLRGADVHLAYNEGATTMTMAAQNGHVEIVKLLVEKGAVVDQPHNDGSTALAQASLNAYGNLEAVDFLLSGGANINCPYARGMPPLHAAAQGGHLKVVKLLVKKGAKHPSDIKSRST
jgi:ankyrin repeat protein